MDSAGRRASIALRPDEYPRRVGLVGSAVAEIALVEVAPGSYALAIDTDANTITVPLHTTPLAQHVAGWVVSERDLVAGLEAVMLEATAIAAVELGQLKEARAADLAALEAAIIRAQQLGNRLDRVIRDSDRRCERLRAYEADAAAAAELVGKATMAIGCGDLADAGRQLADAMAAVARIGGGQ